MNTIARLCGQDSSHLETLTCDGRDFLLLAEVKESWLAFQQDAKQAGFEPFIVSAYRGYDQQLAIWSGKVDGGRKVLDDQDNVIDISTMPSFEKIEAIMRFSALPGCSRHHWGSDFDIAEKSLMPENYRLQLTPSETRGDGVLAPFYDWLDLYMQSDRCAFYRPYSVDRGGVAVEPWHLSHIETARQYEQLANKDVYRAFIETQDMPLSKDVLENFDRIYDRFIKVESP